MAGGGSSREQNFWPGFVDALTNLVLVLVFVVVVFTFALFYFASQLAKQKISEVQAHYEKAAFERMVSTQELQAMREKRKFASVKDTPAPATGGTPSSGASMLGQRQDIERNASQAQPVDQGLPVAVTGQGGAVVVAFAPGVADLSSKETGAIDSALGAVDTARRYELTAEPAEPSPSEGRRLAYYRIAAIRNHLVAAGARAENIDMVIGDPAPAGTPRSRVVIRTRPGDAK